MPKKMPKISRRALLKSAGAGVLAGALASRASWGAVGGDAPPNIIFILADDLGYADVSCFGQREFETPHIDKLADEGMKLTDGYANSPVCSPTRFALISGRYQYRFRGGLFEPLPFTPTSGFPADHPTLPSILREAGYGTVLIGKWHLGKPPAHSPLKSGYDRFFGIYGGGVDYYTYEESAPPRGQAALYEGEQLTTAEGYLTDVLADRAIQEIEGFARGRKPFFMSLHFTAPHWPWETPDATGEQVARDLTNIQHFDGGDMATYASMVKSLDDNIGRVLQALDRSGQRQNTIVIFTSDNGGERFSDNWPFTGMKTELLEGGIRVPVLVRWPARIRPGSVSTQPMMTMDWLPTLLSAAKTQPHPSFPPDGIDVLPVLLGDVREIPRKLFWRYNANDQEAMREGKWKYLKINNQEYLFDISIDPRERGNLKEKFPEVFQRMKSEYQAWDATMLEYRPGDTAYSLKGRLADRY